jgi:hypothetical protein
MLLLMINFIFQLLEHLLLKWIWSCVQSASSHDDTHSPVGLKLLLQELLLQVDLPLDL